MILTKFEPGISGGRNALQTNSIKGNLCFSRVLWAMPRLIPANYSCKTSDLINSVATIVVDAWN